jgi:DNA modification methylase
MSATEFFIWATKNTGAGHTWNYKLAGQKHNVFEYPICQGLERTEHPTQKPEALLKELLTYHTNENDLVLDCFAGSGSTLVACKNLNRRFIGIEISSDYMKIAEERLKQMTIWEANKCE